VIKKNCVMVFGRDDPGAPACLEYSWVPIGKRIPLLLPHDQNVVSHLDQVDTDISQVQVYRLVDGNVGTDTWYLSPAEKNKSIVYATIYVARGQVVATQYFADGTSVTDARLLKSNPLPCPTPPP
jgi:hypothetical protein